MSTTSEQANSLMESTIKDVHLFYRKRTMNENNYSKKKSEDKTKEEVMPFTNATEKILLASFLFSKEAPEDIHDVKLKHFQSIVIRNMVKLVCDFYEKYSRTPSPEEFHQCVDSFLSGRAEKDLSAPKSEYCDVYEEILSLKEEDFEPAQDLFRRHARFQAHNEALDTIIEKRMLEKEDYDGIHGLMIEAYDTGSRDGGLRKLSDIEAKDVEWLWQNHIPLGEITILAGDPGVGKSYFSYFLSAQISKGGSWPDAPNTAIESGKVLILSTDEDPNYCIRPRSDAAGADIDKILVLEGARDKRGRIRIINLTRDIHRLEDILKKDKSYRLLVIDPLSDYVGRIDQHSYGDVRWALNPLLTLARKYHVAVVGIMHCNKNTSLQVLYRIMGSMGFMAMAGSVWVIARDREDEEQKRRFFAPLKHRLGPEQKALAFRLENLGKVARVVFESKPVEDGFDIEEALVPQERAGETKRAKKFILGMLKDGPVLTEEIKSAARDEGIAWATLRRAREKMRGVKAEKENKLRGKWSWYLDEFTRGQALVEADAKARIEATREKHQAEEKK
jgi:putative DNA primase/helicase